MKSFQMYSMDNLAKAITYASEAHSGQYRKGTKIPYIVHPLDVASILLKNLAPESAVIAGLLHDVVDDTDTPIQKIEEIFGKEVAHLVQQVSEPEELLSEDVHKRDTWKTRKSHILSKILSIFCSNAANAAEADAAIVRTGRRKKGD